MSPDLQDVLIEDLRYLHGTEEEQVQFLQTMAEAAAEPQLQQAIQQHLETTRGQLNRLKQIFESLDEKAEGELPEAVQGLVNDAQTMMGMDADNEVIDLELISAGRKMENYEIACYSALRSMANSMGLQDAVKLIDQTLREEEAAERRLAQLAEPLLKRAVEAEDEVEAEEEEEEEEGGGKTFTA